MWHVIDMIFAACRVWSYAFPHHGHESWCQDCLLTCTRRLPQCPRDASSTCTEPCRFISCDCNQHRVCSKKVEPLQHRDKAATMCFPGIHEENNTAGPDKYIQTGLTRPSSGMSTPRSDEPCHQWAGTRQCCNSRRVPQTEHG